MGFQFFALPGCSSNKNNAEPRAEPTSEVEKLYFEALDDLEDHLYPEALEGFNKIKTKFPYSRYAALAELRIADTHFDSHKHLEAVDAYQRFLKFYPNHSEAPYAMAKIGDAYYDQIPSDWWLLPPSAEKDQQNTRLAIAAYRDMLNRFPSSEHSAKARDRVADGNNRLAAHELYVANFYLKRKKHKAAISRAEGMLTKFPGVPSTEGALWVLAQAHKALKNWAQAKTAAQTLLRSYPQFEDREEAETLLKELPATEQQESQS